MSDSPFFNPYQPIRIHERKLPHWQQEDVLYFLTWRLADSIPQVKLDEWKQDRDSWLVRNPPPLTAQQENEYKKRFPARIEDWLDAGWGDCWLRVDSSRKFLIETLDQSGSEIHAGVIMPNHVHLVARIDKQANLKDWTKSVKGRSARMINQGLQRTGPFWQAGYWDRIVRDESHLYRCIRYIERNPAKAGLKKGEYKLLGEAKEVGL